MTYSFRCSDVLTGQDSDVCVVCIKLHRDHQQSCQRRIQTLWIPYTLGSLHVVPVTAFGLTNVLALLSKGIAMTRDAVASTQLINVKRILNDQVGGLWV